MTPTVSILFPIYNTSNYLREAVDSLLSQTFTDFELIALNDCSPDNADEIMDSYDDPRIIRYKGEKNVGLANVLNVGMGMARGKYIARMDSDDISLPQRLEKQVAYLDEHLEIDLVSNAVELFGDESGVIRFDNNSEDVKFEALLYTPIIHPTSMWRKGSFHEKNLCYRQAMVPAEDYDLWTRCLSSGLVLANLPEVLYLYRMHGNQATKQVEKVKEATKKVTRNYINLIFPCISETMCDELSSIGEYASNDMKLLKKSLADLVSENDKSHFFEQKWLANKTKGFYQSHLYGYMLKNGIDWIRVFELKPKHFVKLLKKQLFQ